MLFFTGIVLFCAYIWPSDGQVFQVMTGLLTAFSGAFFMRIKPRGVAQSDNPATTNTVVNPPE
jgi:hypothetical protein